MTAKSRDRVEREIVIRASRERVYAALTDASLYPTWGPERIEGKIAPGEKPIFDFGPAGGGKTTVYVVAVEPPRYFAYRWMQGETDPVALLGDPLQRPNTLVEFHLDEVEGGTRLRVVESGIASLPGMAEAGDGALEGMGKGWQLMLGGLERHFSLADGPQDRIETEVLVRAPRERVYDALVHPEGWWARKVDGELAPGQLPVLDFGQFGKIRIHVEAAEPPGRLAYRRIQGVDDPARLLDDPREGPSTLVEYRLEEAPEGTRVRVVESGFDLLSEATTVHFKRAHQGWGIVLCMLEMHFVST